jgi:hypothetical protein
MFGPFLILALAMPSGAQSGGFIYDQQGTRLSSVFNAKTKWFSFQDKRTANVTNSSSEFAGAFRWCSNEQLHCISGPLNILVPKDFAEGVYDHIGIHCSTRRVALATLTGECTSGGGVRTSYTFERGRGIVSFRLATDQGTYLLRGTVGLFASY